MPHPWPLPPWRVEQGQADVNLHRPNSEKLSVKGKKERPHHAGLGLLTAPGESRGWHLKLDDLCLEEVGFFYMGKNHAKKKNFFFFKRDTNSGSVSLLRHVLEAFVPVVHTGSTTGNLEWAKSLALTLFNDVHPLCSPTSCCLDFPSHLSQGSFLSFRHAAESFCMKYGLCLPDPSEPRALGVTAGSVTSANWIALCLVGLPECRQKCTVLFFFFFFFKQSLMRFFFSHQCWPRSRGLQPLVCNIRKNTQCGCGWVLGCLCFFSLLWEFYFVEAKWNTFLKLKSVDELEAGTLLLEYSA